MKEMTQEHARRLIAELLKVLPHLNNDPSISDYEMHTYDAIQKVTERITFKLPSGEELQFYFVRKVLKSEAA